MTVQRWRSQSVGVSVWLLFSVAGCLIALLVGLLYVNLASALKVSKAADATELIERELRNLREDLLDSETGQRGYLLTLEDRYLQPYRAGSRRAVERLQRLAQSLDASSTAGQQLPQIQRVVNAKLAELTQTVDLAAQGRRPEALLMVNSGLGQQLMDQFRAASQTALDDELRQLSQRRQAFLDQLNNTLRWTLAAAAAALLLLALFTARVAAQLGKPVEALLQGIQSVSEGQLDQQVPVQSDDEVGRISQAFNELGFQLLTARQARDQAQLELERSNAELDSFAYVASHDLKAPLRGIRNLANWVREDIETQASDDTKNNLMLLSRRVDRLDSLLDSLLAYSRVGRKAVTAERVETGRLVAEVADYLAPPPGMVVEAVAPMPVVFAPKAPLELVLRNLIQNAIKHHDRSTGQVTVSGTQEGHWWVFSVQDDGPGIAPEFHERIFQMFQTLKSRDEVEGSGMGLAIVRKWVESQGGSIRVESTPPERGTRFVIHWPVGAPGVA